MAAETPKPKLTVPAAFAEAQVTADGKHLVVIATTCASTAEISQPQLPGELRVIDMHTGETVTARAVPQAFLAFVPERRRAITPDAQYFGWLDNDRWLVVSRVADGQEKHRVDLNALGIHPASCVDTMRISDDGSFIVAEHRGRGAKGWVRKGWVRVEFAPTPHVAASLPMSRRDNVVAVRVAGDGHQGRVAMLVTRKSGLYLLLMDMRFQKLSESVLPADPREPADLSEIRVGDYPLILTAAGPRWMVFSAERDSLALWRFGGDNESLDSVFSWGTVSPDRQHLVIARLPAPRPGMRKGSTLTVWSLSQSLPIRQIPFDEPCSGYRFDAMGHYLSVCGSRNVYVWDFAELLGVSDSRASENRASNSAK